MEDKIEEMYKKFFDGITVIKENHLENLIKLCISESFYEGKKIAREEENTDK